MPGAVQGACQCCAHSYHPPALLRASGCATTWPGELVPARYLWRTQGGTQILLCARCTACWRNAARGQPALAPARITDCG
jgi:hypothetical protein